jgi:hypothetical protein
VLRKKDLRKSEGLILCDNCDTPASWSLSVAVGWVGCGPCILGEADSFDDGDLIPNDPIEIAVFLKELNEQ